MKDSKRKTLKKTLVAKVVKLSSAQTVKVEVEQKFPHPKYSKIVKRHVRYLAHLPAEITGIESDDNVLIEESKPVSKLKKWVVIKNLS